jgi:type I restriction enzyme, S subunit
MNAVKPLPLSSESDVPDGWAKSQLDDIADCLQYGYTASALNSRSGPRFLRITDIQDGKVNWDAVPACDIDRDDLKKYGLGAGDIVFARTGATTGKSYLIRSCPSKAVFASYLIRLRLLDGINPIFVSLFLGTPEYWQYISENVAGNAQPNCNATKLGRLFVPIAPMAEQGRIVTKVEQLAEQVNAARERLAHVPVILKRFRQAVLAAACSGRLTADWRIRNAPADEIRDVISSIRERREAEAKSSREKEQIRQLYTDYEEGDQTELPEGWAFIRLNKLCSSFDYGTSAKSQSSGKVPVLRMGNIQNGKIDWTNLVYTSDRQEIEHYLLRPGTVLFNRTNSPELVGKTAIYAGERPAIFAGYLIRINHLPEIDARYLNLCLNAHHAREFCARAKTDAVSQSNINAQKLGSFEVPFCSLDEQHEIVRRVEALFKLADIIEKRVAAATARADKLTQAILAKAFRGELAPTEAQLARREGRSYEPASALLERVRSQCTVSGERTRRVKKAGKRPAKGGT